jgi:hypothetical protein
MPTYIEGDLFDDAFETPTIIAHVCNDQGRWGSGFVVPLEKRFPDSAACYRAWHRGELTDEQKGKLIYSADEPFRRGATQFVIVDDETTSASVLVANMVAQTLGGKRPLYYNDLSRCMDQVAGVINQVDPLTDPHRIVCPMFGSGLAGGDWNIVERLIEDCWERRGIEVVVYYFERFLPDNFTPPKLVMDTSESVEDALRDPRLADSEERDNA